MKKALALILALIMCLPLCACDENKTMNQIETTTPAKPDSQNGNTDSITSTTGSTTDIDDITNDTQSKVKNHPLFTKLLGTWENQNKDDGYAPYQTLIVNEDGSCSIDGTAATWEWDGSSTTSTLIINIMIDGERVCGAILFSDGTITGQTANYGIGGYYFNTSNSEQ